MDRKDEIKSFFQDRGYDLRKVKGFDDNAEVVLKALNREDALSALELYFSLDIPVLGGDVLFLREDGILDYSHDGWYCDKYEGETEFHYLVRSINESREYLSHYHPSFIKEASLLFDIVPDLKNIF
jgi:hypothetical protein